MDLTRQLCFLCFCTFHFFAEINSNLLLDTPVDLLIFDLCFLLICSLCTTDLKEFRRELLLFYDNFHLVK